MTDREQTSPQEVEARPAAGQADDRRGQVKPTDRPVPRSPEPDADAVREGEEKLKRVKPY